MATNVNRVWVAGGGFFRCGNCTPPLTTTRPATVPIFDNGYAVHPVPVPVADPAPLPPARLHPASTPARMTPSRTLRHISVGRYTPQNGSISLATVSLYGFPSRR